MSAPRMKRLSKMSLMASADRKKFEGVEKPLRTFSLVTFFFLSKKIVDLTVDYCNIKSCFCLFVG